MRTLLISGLGPGTKNTHLLAGSSFDPHFHTHTTPQTQAPVRPFDLARLHVIDSAGNYPLLRPHDPFRPPRFDVPPGPLTRVFPHLTTFTLESILDRLALETTTFRTEDLWADKPEPAGPFDVVLLSTTFIWARRDLARAIAWLRDRYPTAVLVLGGQYSNIKYSQILHTYPAVDFVVRGDAEIALPGLLRALSGHTDLNAIPNLAWRDRDTGALRTTRITYVDLNAEPSPTVQGAAPIVPYESMRGCPFSCRFCSFPAASPKWRHKSATKIYDDWRRYRDNNGTQFIKALDSTFTVPPRRLHQLLPMLTHLGVRWEAYTRANALQDNDTVHALTDAGCASLAIGFESMSADVLEFMDKKVTPHANRTALELLADSDIDHRASFMVGYPGETPEHFDHTHNFLTSDYRGRFSLYVFSLSDETMPVWADADRFKLRVHDPEDPDAGWEHTGMDHTTAHQLQQAALRDIRWTNDDAVLNLWQGAYEMPLTPTRTRRENLLIEKLVERLGMLPLDFPYARHRITTQDTLLCCLADLGITTLNGPRNGEAANSI